jgi:type VI secretion system protein VasG
MIVLDSKNLIGKLDPQCRRALEGAAGLCLSRTNYNVEVEHWLVKLLEQPGNDIALLLRHFGVDSTRLLTDLLRAIDRLRTGSARQPSLSPELMLLTREAWLIASIDQGQTSIRSAWILTALIASETLAPRARMISEELGKLSADHLRRDVAVVIEDSVESEPGAERRGPVGMKEDGGQGAAPQHTATPALDQFTIDLTALARSGKIDPILGRDAEVRQIIDILMRRRQNNPILTGEAGVGKTAVVEGFAQRVAIGDVPPFLANVAVLTLDIGLLQAGAGVRGEFENRLKNVIAEVKKSPKPIILFIDEAHTLIGAGGAAGQADAANLLKPALARGELRVIAATTWAEYKEFFEKDAALARRFQVIKVEEPTEAIAVRMIRGLVGTLEAHHGVTVLDEAVVESVRLSSRYISGRQLPDKAVSLLDTAAARVAIGHAATPPAVEDCHRQIDAIATTLGILRREQDAGADHASRITDLEMERSELMALHTKLESRWKAEAEAVTEIRDLRRRLAGSQLPPSSSEPEPSSQVEAGSAAGVAASAGARDGLRNRLRELEHLLRGLQGEEPLLQSCVDRQAVAAVVSGWTGIPVGRMVSDEIRGVLDLRRRLEERVVGQSHALEQIARRIQTSRAGLTDPKRPIAVFLLAGTSGVGKTETALAIADLLYGGEQNMTVINMSEFKEPHKVSLLMGSPPGYVGYGRGGVLTEAVRRRPYSVILLDEMEKADPSVQDIFYQAFDKGMMKDSEGRDVDFKNTVIIMTSNAGTETVMQLCRGRDARPDPETLAEAIRPDLLGSFKPAFLGRVTVIPYYPLADDVLKGICGLKLNAVRRRVEETYKTTFAWTEEVVQEVVSRCHEVDSGARNIDHILTGSMLPDLSKRLLARMADGGPVNKVRVVMEGGDFGYELD